MNSRTFLSILAILTFQFLAGNCFSVVRTTTPTRLATQLEAAPSDRRAFLSGLVASAGFAVVPAWSAVDDLAMPTEEEQKKMEEVR